mmetsp:Transcript_11822/g.25634  ORF Transcript_11822/g.25634 Transcript_11822/m.25634 type:complete len:213 (+) Transcript_11822:624-1262(+)
MVNSGEEHNDKASVALFCVLHPDSVLLPSFEQLSIDQSERIPAFSQYRLLKIALQTHYPPSHYLHLCFHRAHSHDDPLSLIKHHHRKLLVLASIQSTIRHAKHMTLAANILHAHVHPFHNQIIAILPRALAAALPFRHLQHRLQPITSNNQVCLAQQISNKVLPPCLRRVLSPKRKPLVIYNGALHSLLGPRSNRNSFAPHWIRSHPWPRWR